MYSTEEIKQVLWNVFNTEAENIELTDENNGNYKFNVFPEDDATIESLIEISEDLYSSGLFTMHVADGILKIEYLNPYVLERKEFSFLYEHVNPTIKFEDTQVTALKKQFGNLNFKYAANPFYKSVMNQLENKKQLSKKQYDELTFLLQNGKTRYEAGMLSTKY